MLSGIPGKYGQLGLADWNWKRPDYDPTLSVHFQNKKKIERVNTPDDNDKCEVRHLQYFAEEFLNHLQRGEHVVVFKMTLVTLVNLLFFVF